MYWNSKADIKMANLIQASATGGTDHSTPTPAWVRATPPHCSTIRGCGLEYQWHHEPTFSDRHWLAADLALVGVEVEQSYQASTETRERQTDRDRETERDRQTDRDRERQRHRERHTERETHTHTETDRQRQRDGQTDRERHTERHTQRHRERHTQRHREREREREREKANHTFWTDPPETLIQQVIASTQSFSSRTHCYLHPLKQSHSWLCVGCLSYAHFTRMHVGDTVMWPKRSHQEGHIASHKQLGLSDC